MDTPGYDPVSATGQVAGGANLICFTTGRGSAYGCAPAPSLKLSTNTALWQRQQDDIDINCGGRDAAAPHRGHLAVPVPRRLLAARPVTMTRDRRRRHGAVGHQGQGRRAAAVPAARRRAAASGVMVYGHANGRDIEHTVDEVLRYVELGYQAVRAQSGVPGLDKAYGVGRGKLFYEPADAGLPPSTSGHRALPRTSRRAVRARCERARLRRPPAARRAPPADADRGGAARQGARAVPLFWMEDPTPAENQEAFRLIRQHTTTPIAVGEVFNSIWDCKELIAKQLIDYIRTTVVHAGGITHLRASPTWRRCTRCAPARHGATDLSPVCMGAALHFDLWVPNFGIQEYMRHSGDRRGVPACLLVRAGTMHPGDVPGHGVDIDEGGVPSTGPAPTCR